MAKYRTIKVSQSVFDTMQSHKEKDGRSYSGFISKLMEEPQVNDAKMQDVLDTIPKFNHKQLAQAVAMNAEHLYHLHQEIKKLEEKINE